MAKAIQYTLPQGIIDQVNRSTTATMFGCMNFNMLKGDCDIPDDILKKLIHDKFDDDFVNGLELF